MLLYLQWSLGRKPDADRIVVPVDVMAHSAALRSASGSPHLRSRRGITQTAARYHEMGYARCPRGDARVIAEERGRTLAIFWAERRDGKQAAAAVVLKEMSGQLQPAVSQRTRGT
jgi:hypothetical protein